jgi:hypothetical protein
MPIPKAAIFSGFNRMASSRLTAPERSTVPTPGAPWMRFTTMVSARSESSRRLRESLLSDM